MLHAQSDVTVTLVIAPPYSPYLSDYTEFGGQNILQLTNTTSATLQLKLVGQIEGLDNGIQVSTDVGYQPVAPVTLAPFQTLFVTGATQSMDFLDANHITTNLTSDQNIACLPAASCPKACTPSVSEHWIITPAPPVCRCTFRMYNHNHCLSNTSHSDQPDLQYCH